MMNLPMNIPADNTGVAVNSMIPGAAELFRAIQNGQDFKEEFNRALEVVRSVPSTSLLNSEILDKYAGSIEQTGDAEADALAALHVMTPTERMQYISVVIRFAFREDAEITDLSDNQLTQLSAIMNLALNKVAEILGLPEEAMLNPQAGFQYDPESVDQLSDIKWAIDRLIDLLEQKAGKDRNENDNVSGEANNSTFCGPESTSTLDTVKFMDDLRKEKFHLEFALSQLGIHKIIADKIAERYGVHTVDGIVQAANPNDLGMSTNDIARVFGSLINEELSSKTERVKMITSGQAEMTEIEKAAIELGTVRSEILKIAMGKKGNPIAIISERIKAVDLNVDAANSNVTANAGPDAKIRISGTPIEANINTNASVNIIADTKITANVDTKVHTNTDTTASIKVVANAGANVDITTAADTKITANVDAKAYTNTDTTASIKVVANAGANNAGANVDTAAVVDTKITANVDTKSHTNTDTTADIKVIANAGANVDTAAAADAKITAKTDTTIHTNTNKIAATDSFDLPISAKDATNNKAKMLESVEYANRAASRSVETMAARLNAADSAVIIPICAAESVNRKSANNNRVNAPAAVKIIAATNDAVSIPVSMTEAAMNKKTTDAVTLNDAALAAEHADNDDAANAFVTKYKSASADNSVKVGINKAISENIGASITENGAITENAADNGDNDISGTMQTESASAKDAAVKHAERAFSSFSRIDQEAVIRQLSEKVYGAVRNGAGIHEIRMTLRPETLGEVRMNIRVEGDIIMARMVVESFQAKTIIENNIQSLKDSLEKQNMQVGALSVDVGTDSDKSPRETWEELAKISGLRKSKADGEGSESIDGNDENGMNATPTGVDTGRRFGNNTFEMFV